MRTTSRDRVGERWPEAPEVGKRKMKETDSSSSQQVERSTDTHRAPHWVPHLPLLPRSYFSHLQQAHIDSKYLWHGNWEIWGWARSHPADMPEGRRSVPMACPAPPQSHTHISVGNAKKDISVNIFIKVHVHGLKLKNKRLFSCGKTKI